MRAVVARDRRLVVEDVPDPVPGPGDVLVAVEACGICGSDLHTLAHPDALADVGAAFDLDLGFDPTRDFVLGHEYVARVLEAGPEAAGPSPGDLVVSMPYLLRGDGMEMLGFSNRAPGGYAERMLLSAALCLPVPEGLDARLAALTEPMAVALHTVNRSGIAPGDPAMVIGCGPIGLALILWLRSRGVEPVVAADLAPGRRALAASLGAHAVVDPREERAVDAWRRLAPSRVPVIFEAVGVPGMIDAAVFDAPPGTRIVVAGVCMQPDTFRPLLAVVKELSLQFVYNYTADEFADSLRAIADGEPDVRPLVTSTVGLDGVAATFASLATPDREVKVLIEPGG